MTQTDFLEKIRATYLNARKLSFQPKTNASVLSRGTSHTISAISEDLFGCYCAEKIKKITDHKIYIDPQLSFTSSGLRNKTGKRPLLVRPDVAIVRGDTVKCVFDLKTDLGHKRSDFFEKAKEMSDQLKKIKGLKCSYKDGETKHSQELKIAEDIEVVYIVLTDGNIKKEKINSFIDQIQELENVDVKVLTSGDHLNSYDQNPNFELRKEDFDALDQKLDDLLNTQLM